MSLTDRIGRTHRWHYDPRGNLLHLDNGNGGLTASRMMKPGTRLAKRVLTTLHDILSGTAVGFLRNCRRMADLQLVEVLPGAHNFLHMMTAAF